MKKNIFNKLLLLLVAVSLITFTSCSDDDEPGGGTDVSGTLIGSWNSGSVEINEITINGESLSSFYAGLGLPQEFIDQIEDALAAGASESFAIDLQFNADGTYSATDEEGTETGNWELTNNDTKILFDKGTADEFELDIVELTATRFEGEISEVDNSEDIDEDGTNDEIVINVSLILNKQ